MLIEWSETTYIIAIEITCAENAHMSSLGVQESRALTGFANELSNQEFQYEFLKVYKIK